MNKIFFDGTEINGEDNASGMKRRDFLKWIGLFSATFLAGGPTREREAKSAPQAAEAHGEKSYMVSGWCIPH